MRYVLRIHAIGLHPEIDIDADRFSILKTSREILIEALAIEEKYEIVVANYLDLETKSTSLSVSEMVRDRFEYTDFFDQRMALNISLVNLLTSIRLYSDQLPRHLGICLSNQPELRQRAEKLLSQEYDSNTNFRFMEALRNHVQHYGTPVHRVASGSRWTKLENGLMEFSLYFCAEKKRLSEDKQFKKKVLNEMPDEVNLRLSSRAYVESISSVHQQIREAIKETVQSSRNFFHTAIAEYEKTYEKNPVGLTAYALEGKTSVEEIPIFLDWDDVRSRLERRNRKLINLRKRYVTSEAVCK